MVLSTGLSDPCDLHSCAVIAFRFLQTLTIVAIHPDKSYCIIDKNAQTHTFLSYCAMK